MGKKKVKEPETSPGSVEGVSGAMLLLFIVMMLFFNVNY